MGDCEEGRKGWVNPCNWYSFHSGDFDSRFVDVGGFVELRISLCSSFV